MTLLFRDSDRRVEIRSAREGLIRFRQHAEAVLYFRRHRGRPGLIATLRQMLAEHRHLHVGRLSDDEVIDEVARHLLNGSLQLLEMREPRAEASAALQGLLARPAEEPIEVEAVAPAPPPAAAKPVAPAPEPEPEMFESSLDVAAQVAALTSAAASGVPFCEACTRAAAARAH